MKATIGPHRGAQKIDLLQYPARDYFNKLTKTIEAINAVRISGADRLAQVLDANADKQRNVLITLSALQKVCSLIAAVWLASAVLRDSSPSPCAGRADLALAVADLQFARGRSDTRPQTRSANSIAAQQQMRARLRPIVQQVRHGSGRGGAGQCRNCPGQPRPVGPHGKAKPVRWSKRPPHTEELSATVRHNADSAQQASQLTQTAHSIATQGGQMVGKWRKPCRASMTAAARLPTSLA